MKTVRSTQAALAAMLFAAGAATVAPAWADRGYHERHHHEHHHGSSGAWALGVGLIAGTAIALAASEPRPVYRPTVVYAPPIYTPPVYAPRVVVAEPAPVYAGPRWWYYCAAPAGYYPYVAACATGWTRVAPLPPD